VRMQSLLVAACLAVSSPTSFADDTIEELISRLGQGRKDVRDEIVRRGESAVKPLAKVLQDEKAGWRPRIDAARLLGKIGGQNVVGPLKVALADKNVNVRYFAILALGDVGPVAGDAVPDLAKLLRKRAHDDNLSVGRRELIEVLGKIGGSSREAVDALVLCMKDRSCYEAALALTNFGEHGAEALVTLAANYSKDDRSGNKRHYSEVYQVVAWGMPPLPKEMIPVFKKHFEQGDFNTRRVAGRALAGVGPAAIPVLAKYLDEKNPDLRAEAAAALATMNWFAARAKERGEKVAVPVSSDEFFPKLKNLYKLPTGQVDFRIIQALRGIDRDRFMSDPEMAKVWEEELARALRKQMEKERGRGK
jgi:HEAT repeat protein